MSEEIKQVEYRRTLPPLTGGRITRIAQITGTITSNGERNMNQTDVYNGEQNMYQTECKRRTRELFILKLIEKITKNEKVDKLVNIGVNAVLERLSQSKKENVNRIVYLPERDKRSKNKVIHNCPFPW